MSARQHDRAHLLAQVRTALEGFHQGPESAVTMTDLWQEVTGEVLVPSRRYDQTRPLRSVVRQLRREGLRIAHGDAGYFLARSDAELAATLRWFRSRGISNFQVEAWLARVPPEQLARQYVLDFHTVEDSDDAD